MNVQEIRDLDISSDDFAEMYRVIVEKIVKHREYHNGMIPKNVWLGNLALAGAYTCLELLVVHDGDLYLKVRHDPNATTEGELSWEGNLHIPGTAVLVGESYEKALLRLLNKEILENSQQNVSVTWVGVGRLAEPERNTVADTIYAILDIDDLSTLQGDFERFTGEMGRVIDQHKPVIHKFLAWYDPNELRDALVFDTLSK